jgi:hypothetical protein
MNADQQHTTPPPLDISKWQGWLRPLATIEFIYDPKQLGSSWLAAFLFYLSLCLGALFLVMIHHLCDAAWSAPIRRLSEHLACLSFPTLFILFIPFLFLAPQFYPWMREPSGGIRSLLVFCGLAVLCFAVWGFLSRYLRLCSLKQDSNGEARYTHRMRICSGIGVFLYAITITIAAGLWVQSLPGQWFPAICGIRFFAASAWATLAMLYFLTALFQQTGHLREVLRDEQFYFLCSLLLAFTLFYGYINYSQYMTVWSANLPDETAWFALRQEGAWRWMGALLFCGHFLAPLLILLRMDWKLKRTVMLPLCAWCLLMHLCDIQFQIRPAPSAASYWRQLATDAACLALFTGVLGQVFLRSFLRHAPYPQRDPRMAEALGIHPPPTTNIATAPDSVK